MDQWREYKTVFKVRRASKVPALPCSLVLQPSCGGNLVQTTPTTVFPVVGAIRETVPSLTDIPPSVGPAGPSRPVTCFHLAAGAAGCAKCQAWAPGQVAGSKQAISGQARAPPGASLDSCPRSLAAAHLADPATLHPRLSQRHRIRPGLPGTGLMEIESVLCPSDSLAGPPHSLYPRLCS